MLSLSSSNPEENQDMMSKIWTKLMGDTII